MRATKRQLIVLASLSVVLAILAVYRLSGGDGQQAAAKPAVSLVPDESDQDLSIADTSMPSEHEVWNLPTVDELGARFAREWRKPLDDPFALPASMRIVAPQPPSNAASPTGEVANGESYREAIPPSFTVRSAYQLSGVWYVEINEQVFRAGDELQGYRIDGIARDAIWVSVLSQRDTPDGLASNRPTCVMRVGEQVMGMLDGQWRIDGRDDQIATTSGSNSHANEHDPQSSARQHPQPIRVKVANGG